MSKVERVRGLVNRAFESVRAIHDDPSAVAVTKALTAVADLGGYAEALAFLMDNKPFEEDEVL